MLIWLDGLLGMYLLFVVASARGFGFSSVLVLFPLLTVVSLKSPPLREPVWATLSIMELC